MHHSFKKDLLKNEKRGEGKETERRPEWRRELPPLRRYPPRNKEKISKVGTIHKIKWKEERRRTKTRQEKKAATTEVIYTLKRIVKAGSKLVH